MVVTVSVCWPAVPGFVMPLKTTLTAWPAPMLLPENSEHWIVSAVGLAQLPTSSAVALRTVPLV